MATQKYERASSLSVMTGTMDLSGLAAGASKLCTPEFDNANTSNLWFWGDFILNVQFGTVPTAGRAIELYLIPALDGTVYADGDTTTPPRNLLVGAFVVIATTNMQRIVLRGVPLPPAKFKLLVRNNTDQAFAASPSTGHDLEILPYRTQSA
jgi:hypothetical protein